MKQQYRVNVSFWLTIIGVLRVLATVQAQSVSAPVLQWQRVIEGSSFGPIASVRAIKAGNNGYGLLAGKTLIRLSTTGEVVWNKAVPDSYADSSTNRVAGREALAFAPTSDGGFVVLASDAANKYYVAKLDSAGNNSWAKTIDRADRGPSVRVTQNALSAAPDGSILVIGSYTDSLAYLAITRLTAEGVMAGQWRVKFTGSSQSETPIVQQILPLADQGYLLIGQSAGRDLTSRKGIAIQLDAHYKLTWQQAYPALRNIPEAVVNPAIEGTYTAIGTGADGINRVITIAPNKSGDGTTPALFPTLLPAVSLAADGAGTLTVLDAFASNNGDFRLTNGTLPTTLRWTKIIGGSGADVPTALLATDDGGYLAVGTTTSTDGDVVGKSTPTVATWAVKLGQSAQLITLRLLSPIYDCQTGFIRFQTSGGDGSLITYSAPGITRARPADNFGTVELGLRQDPKVIPIQATQSGQTVYYPFDLTAYCRSGELTASVDSLRLIAPTYDCQTGAITFHTSGGDGSLIEYAAAGITDWTTNPDQFVDKGLRMANDVQPLRLMARQHGQTITYLFDLKAACGRARISTDEPSGELTVTLLGNPAGETAYVQIVGAQGKAIRLQLFDTRGGLVDQRVVEQAGSQERQWFDLRSQAAGPLLLHTTVNGQTQTMKIIKQ